MSKTQRQIKRAEHKSTHLVAYFKCLTLCTDLKIINFITVVEQI